METGYVSLPDPFRVLILLSVCREVVQMDKIHLPVHVWQVIRESTVKRMSMNVTLRHVSMEAHVWITSIRSVARVWQDIRVCNVKPISMNAHRLRVSMVARVWIM